MVSSMIKLIINNLGLCSGSIYADVAVIVGSGNTAYIVVMMC